jgi:hypothetical protein
VADGGYIKLHRKILEWGWYDDPNTFRLFIFLLLTVNWQQKSWHGRDILPGQLVTSLAKMSQGTGLTLSQVRTCLDKLKMTSEIAHETTQHYSLVTISKWALYQSDDEIIAQKTASTSASQSHPNRIPIASQSQQLKKEKKERREEGKKDIYGEFANVKLTEEEHGKLVERFGKSDTIARIERLSGYLASTGKRYNSHYATILNWARKDAGQVKTNANFKQRDYTDDQLIEMYEPVETEET